MSNRHLKISIPETKLPIICTPTSPLPVLSQVVEPFCPGFLSQTTNIHPWAFSACLLTPIHPTPNVSRNPLSSALKHMQSLSFVISSPGTGHHVFLHFPVCVCQSQTPNLSLPSPLLLGFSVPISLPRTRSKETSEPLWAVFSWGLPEPQSLQATSSMHKHSGTQS